jgi:hypothetical protein
VKRETFLTLAHPLRPLFQLFSAVGTQQLVEFGSPLEIISIKKSKAAAPLPVD